MTPTLTLGSGFRRTFDFDSKSRDDVWQFDLHWNYEYIYSWQLGAEVNHQYYAERPAEYADWGRARHAFVYPSVFDDRSLVVPVLAANGNVAYNSTAMLQHFIAYAHGASLNRTLPRTGGNYIPPLARSVTPGLRHSGQLTGQGRRLSTSAALKGDDETLAQRSAVANTGNVSLPLPTAAQLHWHRGGKYGISALVHFNMATFFKDGDPGCSPENWPGTNGSSNPASFNPSDLSTDDWASAMKPLGIAEAVLVAKHGCGFATWPTEVQLPNGTRYPYRSSVDVLGKFVASMTSAGIGHGIYYSFSNNFFLNKLNCIGGCVPACKHFSSSMKNCDLLPGQVNITNREWEVIAQAQVTELWKNYGNLTEIWFVSATATVQIRSCCCAVIDDLWQLVLVCIP